MKEDLGSSKIALLKLKLDLVVLKEAADVMALLWRWVSVIGLNNNFGVVGTALVAIFTAYSFVKTKVDS